MAKGKETNQREKKTQYSKVTRIKALLGRITHIFPGWNQTGRESNNLQGKYVTCR